MSIVALAYAGNARFELLDDIAPGPALSTVLSPYPLVSLVALNIIPARNSHDAHSGGVGSAQIKSRRGRQSTSAAGMDGNVCG